METENPAGQEIEETNHSESTPLISPNSGGTTGAKTGEVEVHLFRRGQGPIAVFKSKLGGWEQDQLEVVDILEKYGLKSIYAFNSSSGRGVPIRFNHKNGRSMLPYTPGSLIFVDGEPKDSLIKPITKILVGVAVITLLIVLVMRETPQWAQKFNFTGGSFPPWIIACVVIVFTRMRKRTINFLSKTWSKDSSIPSKAK